MKDALVTGCILNANRQAKTEDCGLFVRYGVPKLKGLNNTRTPVLDTLAVILFLFSMVLVTSMALAYFAPEAITLVRSHHISPVCSTVQAVRGLRTHRMAAGAASDIKHKSSLMRTEGGYHQWSTPQGNYWIPEMTDDALWILLGQQERDIYDEGQSAVTQGDIVLDCGAHVGVFARTALKRGAKLVVAIEPAPENLECLRRNFSTEIGKGNVIIYPKGVWSKDDFLPMYLNRNSAGDSFVLDLDPGQKVVQLPLTTIDKIVAELSLPRVDFIKMDIKGAEVQALQGARRTLAVYQPRMSIASEHLETDPETIPRTVKLANSRYRVTCGSCYLQSGVARPEVLHFY
jgi:FkbM family methyltransferase